MKDSVRQSSASWSLLAPVFDHRRRRSGLWLEVACRPDQAARLAALLEERLAARAPEWLFLLDHAGQLASHLPLALRCDQVLVRPLGAAQSSPNSATEPTAAHDAQPPQGGPQQPPPNQAPPPGLLAGLRGPRAQLEQTGLAQTGRAQTGLAQANVPQPGQVAWHVVTDPIGADGPSAPIGSVPALADGLASWQQCQPLADLGWKAFMMTGNQSAAGKQPKADQLALTRLLGLITSDADIDELESLFKTQPRLAYDLLNLVNSPALNLRTPATNFRHAITLLGRRQLQRWLQLLMFTRQTSKGEINILLWHSAFRGRLMELLAQQLARAPVPPPSADHSPRDHSPADHSPADQSPADQSPTAHSRSDPRQSDAPIPAGPGQATTWTSDLADQAFMVGVFSLIDVLLGDSLAHLLRPLALPEPILAALLEQRGPLGQLLALARAVEARDSQRLSTLSQHLALDAITLFSLQSEALFWVESFSSSAGN